MAANREYTPKFWAALVGVRQFKVVPKDIKPKTIERWIQQLIQKGREYLAALAVSKRRAEESPLSADPARQAEQMGIIRTILHGKGGGDPAPAV